MASIVDQTGPDRPIGVTLLAPDVQTGFEGSQPHAQVTPYTINSGLFLRLLRNTDCFNLIFEPSTAIVMSTPTRPPPQKLGPRGSGSQQQQQHQHQQQASQQKPAKEYVTLHHSFPFLFDLLIILQSRH